MTAQLVPQQFSVLENFGHSLRSQAYLVCPQEIEQIPEIFHQAKLSGLTVTVRGAGRSYNDASLNSGNIVIDMQKLNRILEWHPENGVVKAEPGVTLQQLWQRVLPDGWWPPVVSGTMLTTLGGCLGMNIHGKNSYKAGTIGEHVLEFTVLLPTGAHLTCSPHKNADLFFAMIGGLGMLGVFTSITFKMKPVETGLLMVDAWNFPSLQAGLADIESRLASTDYIVGWIDCTAGGRKLGRGQMHSAVHLPRNGVESHNETLQVEYQTLPSKFAGLVPKSVLYRLMRPFMNNLGVLAVNSGKYLIGRTSSYRQSHAAFHFLLDYVPNWERSYGNGGLIQYQSFVPANESHKVFSEILTIAQQRKLPPYLGVLKRHRPDSQFLLSHAVDGFSLALDFKISNRNRPLLDEMLQEFDRIVLAAGGRFYFAKNSEMRPDTARAYLGEERLERFFRLKQRCDPNHLLESDLFRRVFGI